MTPNRQRPASSVTQGEGRSALHGGRRQQNGAALLLAMIILVLITTLAAGMVWQQWRAIQVESAERARVQSGWILTGALDYARLILREDLKSGPVDNLGEPWAVPLAEARLSSFLAADKSSNAADDADDGPDAFLSGQIADAMARYNLRNLVGADGKPVPAEVAVLGRLCEFINVPASTAQLIATGLQSSLGGTSDNAAVAPQTVEEMVWLGIDPADLKRLANYVVLLPQDAATVNVNTAPKEVLAAVIDGLDLGTADRLVQARAKDPFKDLPSIATQLPTGAVITRLGVASNYFEVEGKVRLGDRILEERSLVHRVSITQVDILRRERVNSLAGS